MGKYTDRTKKYLHSKIDTGGNISVKSALSPLDEANHIAKMVIDNGVCLTRCDDLDGDVVAFVRDERFRPQVPKGFVTYDLLEIELVSDLPVESLRLIHKAKVVGGADAKITDVLLEGGSEDE